MSVFIAMWTIPATTPIQRPIPNNSLAGELAPVLARVATPLHPFNRALALKASSCADADETDSAIKAHVIADRISHPLLA
jgi:hypothetical protein